MQVEQKLDNKTLYYKDKRRKSDNKLAENFQPYLDALT